MNNLSYLIYGVLIIIAVFVIYMTNYAGTRRRMSRNISAGQDEFRNFYDNIITLFFTLLCVFLIFKEFNNDIKSGFIALGCFILSMIITSLVIPKIESNYFVKLVLNDLIKAEGDQKKNDQEKAKTIRNYINKIKEHYKKQL